MNGKVSGWASALRVGRCLFPWLDQHEESQRHG